MSRDDPGVALVFGVAVAGKDCRDNLVGRGQLRQARDDGGVDSTAEAHHESSRAAGGKFPAHPADNLFSRRHATRFYRGAY
jgi:hypothetical protein